MDLDRRDFLRLGVGAVLAGVLEGCNLVSQGESAKQETKIVVGEQELRYVSNYSDKILKFHTIRIGNIFNQNERVYRQEKNEFQGPYSFVNFSSTRPDLCNFEVVDKKNYVDKPTYPTLGILSWLYPYLKPNARIIVFSLEDGGEIKASEYLTLPSKTTQPVVSFDYFYSPRLVKLPDIYTVISDLKVMLVKKGPGPFAYIFEKYQKPPKLT